jgi:hypothetical protein
MSNVWKAFIKCPDWNKKADKKKAGEKNAFAVCITCSSVQLNEEGEYSPEEVKTMLEEKKRIRIPCPNSGTSGLKNHVKKDHISRDQTHPTGLGERLKMNSEKSLNATLEFYTTVLSENGLRGRALRQCQ